MWSATRVVYSVGPASTAYLGTLQFPLQQLKQSALSARVTRSLGRAARSGRGPGPLFTYRRGLRTDARLEKLDDQEVQLWKKREELRGAL